MEPGGSYLTQGERERLWADQEAGISLRASARRLGRSHTSLGRELKRNAAAAGYVPHRAQRQAAARIRAANARRSRKAPAVRRYVHDKLTSDWSPEQIAGRLKREGLGTLSPETIYAWIYQPAWKPQGLWVFLRRGQPRRRQYPGRKAKKQFVPNRTWVDARPVTVGQRTEFGHWETDLMEGTRAARDVLSVTTERVSGYLLADHLPDKTAAAKHASLVRRLDILPPWLRRTITTDPGSENAHHEQTTAVLGAPVYFCHPYHSWEKGTVENTIGLIRQYLPKRTSLAGLTPSDVALVTTRLNHRPRKRLGYRTPHEVLCSQLEVVQTV